MKNYFYFIVILFVFLFGVKNNLFAQAEPVLYFCEKYGDDGEVNVTDRFSTGDYITIIVKCDYALKLTDCSIQFEKYNTRTRDFDFYKKFYDTLEPDMKYISFGKDADNDLKFEDPGFYRVFLLDGKDKTVASALIEIIPK